MIEPLTPESARVLDKSPDERPEDEKILQVPETRTVEWEPTTEEEQIVLELIQKLSAHGIHAYITGGYTRDLLMAKNPDQYPDAIFDPHDIDLSVDRSYDEVKRALQSEGYTSMTEAGKNYAVLLVNVPRRDGGGTVSFEIASFRTESDYSSDRKPQSVAFTSSMREDAQRRDFTIGAMYFDPLNKAVIDHVGGMRDIDHRELHMVGNPQERIDEDPLRMLRYVRFRNKFGMEFSRDIQDVFQQNVQRLHDLPPERFHGPSGEMDKILEQPRSAFAIGDMARLGMLQEILPEVSALIGVHHTPAGEKAAMHREGDVFRHTLEVLRTTSRPEFTEIVVKTLGLDPETSNPDAVKSFFGRFGVECAWAALLHDVGKASTQELNEKTGAKRYQFYGHESVSAELAEAIVERFRFSNDAKAKVVYLIQHHTQAHSLGNATREERNWTKIERDLYLGPHAEELVFLAFADELGNYFDGATPADKIEKFFARMEALHALRKDQELKEKVSKVRGLISDLILKEFMPSLQEQRKGYRFIGRIHTKITDWIKYDTISTEQLGDAVRYLHEQLLPLGWTEEQLLTLADGDLTALGTDVDHIGAPPYEHHEYENPSDI
ncbi:MAG: HD domain-containing protein [Patescibacteria group bacterium]